jgi:hypothetical protein
VARLHDEQGNPVAYYQLPYSFKSVANANHLRDGGLQDKYLSIAHPPALSPAATTATFESGSSSASYRTASSRSTVSSYSQPPAPLEGQDRTSPHYPVSPILRPSHPPPFGVGSRKNRQQLEASDQALLQKVVPIEGPTQGGVKIVLIGTNFPTGPTIIYARFGSTVAPTVSHSMLLHLVCITLPYSPG